MVKIKRIYLAVAAVLAIAAGGVFVLTHSGPTSPFPSRVQQTVAPHLTVAVSPSLARQDGKIRVTGSGFLPDETVVVRASQDPTGTTTISLAQARATMDGTFTTGTFTLPANVYSGVHALDAQGELSGRKARGTLNVQAKAPWLTVSSNATKAKSTYGFVLGGFKPGEKVIVAVMPAPKLSDGQSQDTSKLTPPATLASVSTDKVGNAKWTSVQLPLLEPGSYTLTAKGNAGSKAVQTSLVIEPFSPVVQLSPWAGPPGAKVQLNAKGFAPDEQVQVFDGSTTAAALTLTTDQYGNFWGAGPLRIPYGSTAESLPLVFVGQQSGARVTVPFKVLAPKPWLTLTAYYGPPGGPVGFSGGGWAADERVTFHLASAQGPVVAEGLADDYGWLRGNAMATVPGDPTNMSPSTKETSVVFVAVGDESHATASASFKVQNPFANLPPLPQAPQVPQLPQQPPP